MAHEAGPRLTALILEGVVTANVGQNRSNGPNHSKNILGVAQISAKLGRNTRQQTTKSTLRYMQKMF